MFKNLYLYTKMRNVGGISQTEALKASDLYMKCRYLDELTGNKGVVFATGTPFPTRWPRCTPCSGICSTTRWKAWSLPILIRGRRGLGNRHVDGTQAGGKGFQQKTRFANFYNLPELMAIFKEVADIQTADMLNLPVPKANYKTVVCKPSEMQKEMVSSLPNAPTRCEAARLTLPWTICCSLPTTGASWRWISGCSTPCSRILRAVKSTSVRAISTGYGRTQGTAFDAACVLRPFHAEKRRDIQRLQRFTG